MSAGQQRQQVKNRVGWALDPYRTKVVELAMRVKLQAKVILGWGMTFGRLRPMDW